MNEKLSFKSGIMSKLPNVNLFKNKNLESKLHLEESM